ncbi:MAG: hypothetical protein AAF436_06065 [Myxococcota bacterium]
MGACAPSLDIPPPPDIQPVLDAFDSPTADVRAEIMGESDDQIARASENITESLLLRRILDIIESVRAGLDDAIDDGDLSANGDEYSNPNGVVDIISICPGWDPQAPEPDEANGKIDLTMLLVEGRISPEVWGTVEGCQFLVDDREWSFDGVVTVHFGDVVDVETNLNQLVVTFVVEGTLRLGDQSFELAESARISGDGRLEILIQLADRRTFVYFFEPDEIIQGIRDITGVFGCSLENRECDKGSDGFFW